MGTLYIDRKDLHIRLDGNALVFYCNGEREGSVPVTPLRRVIIVGNVTIETRVLHRLSDEGISVVFLSGKRLRFRGMLHGRLHKNGILRMKQYEKFSSQIVMELAKDIVRRKVVKQVKFLEEVKEKRPDLAFELTRAGNTLVEILRNIENASTIDSLRGFEGGATSAYFSAYVMMFAPSLDFEKRTRRPPEDPVNAMLSLCYTLLHFEMVREIEVIGLDPTIGFYHQFEYGRESLACDLVEPYRIDVDRFVYDLFRTREFTSGDFSEDDERPGCYLKKQARKKFYPIYEQWARTMRQKWIEEVRGLARRIMDGKDPLSE